MRITILTALILIGCGSEDDKSATTSNCEMALSTCNELTGAEEEVSEEESNEAADTGTLVNQVSDVIGADDDFALLSTDRWTVTDVTGALTSTGGVLAFTESTASTDAASIRSQFEVVDQEFEITLDLKVNSTTVDGSGVIYRVYFANTEYYEMELRNNGGANQLVTRMHYEGVDYNLNVIVNPGYELKLAFTRTDLQTRYRYSSDGGASWSNAETYNHIDLNSNIETGAVTVEVEFNNPTANTSSQVDNFSINGAGFDWL